MANSYKRYLADLTANVQATVFTVPVATTALIRSILIGHNSGGTAHLTITVSPAGNGSHIIIPYETVGNNKYVEFLTAPLVLEAGDALKVTSTQDDTFVTVSALLVDRN